VEEEEEEEEGDEAKMASGLICHEETRYFIEEQRQTMGFV
jgi:hypothetical protein